MQSVGWWLPATASCSGTVPRAPLAWLQGRGEARAHSPSALPCCATVPALSPGGETGPEDPPGLVIPDKGPA